MNACVFESPLNNDFVIRDRYLKCNFAECYDVTRVIGLRARKVVCGKIANNLSPFCGLVHSSHTVTHFDARPSGRLASSLTMIRNRPPAVPADTDAPRREKEREEMYSRFRKRKLELPEQCERYAI